MHTNEKQVNLKRCLVYICRRVEWWKTPRGERYRGGQLLESEPEDSEFSDGSSACALTASSSAAEGRLAGG